MYIYGGRHKTGLLFGVISSHFRFFFLKVKLQNWIFFFFFFFFLGGGGVLFLVCLIFLIVLGGKQ